jgi:general secretion pathway protein G
MTLMEVMIVVVIMGLISGGIAMAIFPMLERAKLNTTHTSARILRQGALAWRGLNASDECPTPQRLRDEGTLDLGAKLTDAWEMPYKIECRDTGETVVISMGPDKHASADDIVEPEAAKRL